MKKKALKPFSESLRRMLVEQRDSAQHVLDEFDREQARRLRAHGRADAKRCPKRTFSGQCTLDENHDPLICAGAGIGPWSLAD